MPGCLPGLAAAEKERADSTVGFFTAFLAQDDGAQRGFERRRAEALRQVQFRLRNLRHEFEPEALREEDAAVAKAAEVARALEEKERVRAAEASARAAQEEFQRQRRAEVAKVEAVRQLNQAVIDWRQKAAKSSNDQALAWNVRYGLRMTNLREALGGESDAAVLIGALVSSASMWSY